MTADELRSELAEILPKSQHKKIDTIVAVIEPEPWSIYAVDVAMSHVGIETVEAYGLVIKLDATGDAASVEFPYGADIAA
ncbi:hypothetical protein GCM10010435_66090 [Winogradskya consettensis]|uniref:Uncharacterized protein n=1 Tax=Winogradskya consettensis TaxID=113560 RepID=A0A919T580_9ACTN|nr:hypothetical protein [Actinoplanes consettensis]GIM84755.1 hypothetical protein Aco04nite_92990 [Actinoplanes consettensis]